MKRRTLIRPNLLGAFRARADNGKQTDRRAFESGTRGMIRMKYSWHARVGTAMVSTASIALMAKDFPSKPPVAVASPKSAAQPVRQGVNWFRESLPIDIVVETGSVVLGSDASPMVLIGDVKRANGTLHITDVSGQKPATLTLVSLAMRSLQVTRGHAVPGCQGLNADQCRLFRTPPRPWKEGVRRAVEERVSHHAS